MSCLAARRLTRWIMAVSVALVALGLALSLLALVASDGKIGPVPHQLFNPVITITYCLFGTLIASRFPRNPVGWLFSGSGFLIALSLLTTGYVLYAQSLGPGSLPGVELARWLDNWVWIPPMFLTFTFLLLLFPDGRLLSRRWLPVAWLAGVGLVGGVLSAVVYPPLYDSDAPPLAVFWASSLVAEVATLLAGAGWIAFVLSFIGSVAALVVRFRRSRGVERAQVKWLVYAGCLAILGFVVDAVIVMVWPDNPLTNELNIIIIGLAAVAIVAATGVAIVSHHLYDIDLLINRTAVYSLLTAIVVALYVGIVGLLGSLFQSGGDLLISLAATGIVAVIFQPVRDRVQRAINRLMYGERDDPYTVLARLGQRLEATLVPDQVLPTIGETIAQALKLPYVAIALQQGAALSITAAYGLPTNEPLRLPLTYQAETVGQLILAPRGPGEIFTPADQRLLEGLTHQVGVAVHAVRLTADLQRSREQLVTAREEERRRLRRDLHDGLGQALASLTLQLDALRNVLAADPPAADELVVDLKAQVQAALADIRRLVYALRPPALDELGLVAALRQQAAQVNHPTGLRVTVEAPEALPPLSAAVEVAAYRIALEALTNVVRHARAGQCCIRLALDGALCLEVVDNGCGLPAGHQAGVGLTSMRERAAELGGTCLIQPAPAIGTRVLARLPLPTEP